MASFVERLRENIIAPAFGDGSIRDGQLCERLIRERHAAADRIAELEAALAEACNWIADGCISAADEIMVNKLRKTLQQAS